MWNPYGAVARITRDIYIFFFPFFSFLSFFFFFPLSQTGVLSRFHYFMCIHHENNNSVDLSFSIRIRIGARSIHRLLVLHPYDPFTIHAFSKIILVTGIVQ